VIFFERTFKEWYPFDASNCLSSYLFAYTSCWVRLWKPQTLANLDWFDSLCSYLKHFDSLMPRSFLFGPFVSADLFCSNFLWHFRHPLAFEGIWKLVILFRHLWFLACYPSSNSIPMSFFKRHRLDWILEETKGLPLRWSFTTTQWFARCAWIYSSSRGMRPCQISDSCVASWLGFRLGRRLLSTSSIALGERPCFYKTRWQHRWRGLSTFHPNLNGRRSAERATSAESRFACSGGLSLEKRLRDCFESSCSSSQEA